MTRLSRSLAWCAGVGVFLFSLFGSSLASAATGDVPALMKYRYCVSTAGCNVWEDSVSAAQADFCPAQVAANRANPGDTTSGCIITNSGVAPGFVITYHFIFGNNQVTSDATRSVFVLYYCADPSIPVNPDNTCTPKVTPPTNPCETNDTAHSYVRSFTYANGAAPGSLPQDDGVCKISNPVLLKCYDNVGGAKYCFFEFYKTKQVKDSAPPPGTPAPAPADSTKTDPLSPADKPSNSPPLPPDNQGNCPKGTVQYGVDSSGVPMCIGTGTLPKNPAPAPTTSTGPTSTVTNSDGSTTATTTTTQQNSDGSTTTTVVKVVTLPDGTKTQSQTSDTSANSSGGAGKVDAPPSQQQIDLCAQHPELAICRNSSVGGSCGEITCTGDAVQCATLRAAAIMQCNQQADIDALKASPQKATGDAILSGNDPAKGDIDAFVKGSVVDMSAPSIDQSAFLGASSCLAQRSFTVLGKTVTMDFATVCSNVQPLRSVIMALAFIVSYLIVARSVLQA